MGLRVLANFLAPGTGTALDIRTGSGFTVRLDGPAQGSGSGPGPREMVLGALAGCTALDVSSILGKKRQPPATYEIAVEADASVDHPQVFTAVRVEHRVSGDVEPDALRRAVELSATRYCPVSAMLAKAVAIEHRYHLERPGWPHQDALVVVTGPA